jgi:type IV pilus assembly protein PilY1
MRDLNNSANRTSLYTQFYRDWVRSGGTPNRAAVYNLVRNFKRTDSGAPVQYYCQKNFGMLFTDGFSNPPAPGDGFYSIGNVDGTHGPPYQDSVSGTMADGVMDAYINNIRPDLTPTGRVSVPPGCSATHPDPRLDCNTNLHMNFFAVTLGTRGLQFDPDASPPQDPYVSPPTWPTTFPARHPNAVDDIWHATINGRGKLLNANNPSELSTKLAEILTTIIERTGSASSASINSGAITENTRVYQARFNSTFWTGELSAYPISATGVVQTRVWEAGALLPEPNSRQIITLNSDGTTAVPFRWASLDATRRAELSTDPTLGQDILNYIRGDASREGINPTNFRVRPSKLGDIISSSPAYVGRPNYRYRDSLEASPYSAFVAAHSARTPMVYVGANDGMLHGFNAETGVEVFAYIPSPVFSRLKNLTARNYSHQYFVDGSPSVADAYIGGSWRTVLVGGLNKGGRGMFALDITNPSQLAVAEAAPNSVVMWEFTDADDADLGYTYSQATIARLHNGQWAAIFGNGYNSPSGTAVLYVVNLHTGALIRKFDTQMTPARAPTGVTWDNGLSSPAVVDIDGDRIQDYVYAGDLYGNLWKFDISSSDPTEWSIPYTDASSRPAPLFAARDGAGNAQPITVRPVVIRGPFGEGMVVLFGTGKYLENADRNITPERRQSFYGIVDRNTNTNGDLVTGRSALTRQQILQEVTTPAGRARITSNHMIGATSGWYIDLVSPSGYNGERQITNPTVRDGVVHFTTMIPNADPCGAGGRSWIMSMDALNGARPQAATQFDVNRDGQITDADNVVVGGTPVHVSGLQPDDDVERGILWDPAILTSTGSGGGEAGGGCIQYRVMPDSFGNMTQEAGPCGPGSTGRQSWRQIR